VVFVAAPLGVAWGGRERFPVPGVGPGLQLEFTLRRTRGTLAGVDLRELNRRWHGKEVLSPPLPLHGAGAVGFALLAVPVA
jgi:hypothetical protein